MEYLIGEMFWFQEIKEAKQSDPDHLWSHQHITGSCAEGLCIPNSLLYKSGNDISEGDFMTNFGSDLDVMPVKEAFVTINDEQIQIFDIIQSGNDPRYVFLTLTEQWKKLNPAFGDSVYLHQSFLLTPGVFQKFKCLFPQKEKEEREEEIFQDKIHGPARQLFIESLENVTQVDITEVFKYPNAWPESAKNWLNRPRKSGWPSRALVQGIFDSGCHLAPVGRGKRACEPIDRDEYLANPATVTFKQSQVVDETTMDEYEWRISFSLAENKLGQSLSPVKRHIMVLLKIIKKAYLSDHDVISTYLLKHLFFWECENRDNDFWREDNSAECLLSVMDHLVECLKKRHLSHYIMPKSNLLKYEDPVKLDEAAKTVLEVRKNIVQKTVSFLTRLQSMMFQSKEFLSNVQKKLIITEDANELLYSICQLYKQAIEDEHRSNNENVMKCQQIRSIIDRFLSVFEVSNQLLSINSFFQSSPKRCDLISSTTGEKTHNKEVAADEHSSNNENVTNSQQITSILGGCPSMLDIPDQLLSRISFSQSTLNKIDSISSIFEEENFSMTEFENFLERFGSSILLFVTCSHVWHLWEEMCAIIAENYTKLHNSSWSEFVKRVIKIFESHMETETKVDSKIVFRNIICLICTPDRKGIMTECLIHARNLLEIIFSNISPLHLRVHKSLLARSYCKLWFSKNGKSSEQSKDRESFTLSVREDIKSCPHLDEEFIELTLTFFEEMILGTDSCQIVPETTVMKQIKEIHQRIAHEIVKLFKLYYIFFEDILIKDDRFFNDVIDAIANMLEESKAVTL